MRRNDRSCLSAALMSLLALLGSSACSSGGRAKVAVPDHAGSEKTQATLRALRRAYDGAPPTIPHKEVGASCVECHNVRGMHVEGLGFAPPSPHEATAGLSSQSLCRQCHVPIRTDELFVANLFEGLRQDLRHGSRQHALAPPRMPHPVFMRENCTACHSGPAAREEIRTPHPERERCQQCHLPIVTSELFAR